MPSSELFVDTEPLFEGVGALRERFAAAQGAEAVPILTLSNATGTEVLGLLASLATTPTPSTRMSPSRTSRVGDCRPTQPGW
jgi:hypothetical protein